MHGCQGRTRSSSSSSGAAGSGPLHVSSGAAAAALPSGPCMGPRDIPLLLLPVLSDPLGRVQAAINERYAADDPWGSLAPHLRVQPRYAFMDLRPHECAADPIYIGGEYNGSQLTLRGSQPLAQAPPLAPVVHGVHAAARVDDRHYVVALVDEAGGPRMRHGAWNVHVHALDVEEEEAAGGPEAQPEPEEDSDLPDWVQQQQQQHQAHATFVTR